MPFKEPEKRREYRRKWYEEHRNSEKKHVKNRKELIRKWILNYKKNLRCSICSESHPAILDFHHKWGKEFTVNYLVANGYSVERIKRELEKCVVLCSNCHRKLHYKNKKL
jgi:hypothetical protein